MGPSYPSDVHRRAAEAVVGYFEGVPDVDAVLLYASCARGKASPGSCLDIAVLVRPEILATQRQELEQGWDGFHRQQHVFREGERLVRYQFAELFFVDGDFRPGEHDWTSGPDEFELAIGNTLVYTRPLLERGEYLADLKRHWLPYYGERLRQRRLAQVVRCGRNNIDHVGWFVDRGLHFQAFHRLYNAHREFLQALFMSRRVYPIAYDKWIREQVAEILDLPELYVELSHLFELAHFESAELTRKAARLEELYGEYLAG